MRKVTFFLISCFFFFNSVKAQDVIYTVKAVYNNEAIRLDSILIDNRTGGKSLLFKDLPNSDVYESGNGNNGTVNGATLTTDRKGNPNSAYSFNQNYIDCGNSDIFNINTSFSITFWQYKTNNDGAQVAIGKGNDLTQGSFNIFDNCIKMPVHVFIGNITPNLNEWEFVTVTYDIISGNISYIIDGNVIETVFYKTGYNISNNQPLIIGRHQQSGSYPYWFYGKIDDINLTIKLIFDANSL